jgi:FAD/FMN-containing dehydrogenase
VKYANARNIPFLAYNGGHGCIAGLDTVQNGIQIKLTRLNSVTVSDEGDIATCGGGIIGKTLVDALWKVGKQTGEK